MLHGFCSFFKYLIMCIYLHTLLCMYLSFFLALTHAEKPLPLPTRLFDLKKINEFTFPPSRDKKKWR